MLLVYFCFKEVLTGEGMRRFYDIDDEKKPGIVQYLHLGMKIFLLVTGVGLVLFLLWLMVEVMA